MSGGFTEMQSLPERLFVVGERNEQGTECIHAYDAPEKTLVGDDAKATRVGVYKLQSYAIVRAQLEEEVPASAEHE